MWLRKEKKKAQKLIRFCSASYINNYNREGEKEKRKKKKIQKNLQNKSKHKNDKCFSWVTVVKSPFPRWESQSTSPP